MADAAGASGMLRINPSTYLNSLVGKPVVVKLKCGSQEYKGNLVSVDKYFNLKILNAEEFTNGASTGNIEKVFIRNNNILYTRRVEEEEKKD